MKKQSNTLFDSLKMGINIFLLTKRDTFTYLLFAYFLVKVSPRTHGRVFQPP